MHFVNPDGANLVCYFQPEGDGAEGARDARRLCDWVDANSSPSFARTLRRFLEADDDAYRAARVKLCARLHPQSPLMLRKCVPTKPVLVGKRASTRFFRGAGGYRGVRGPLFRVLRRVRDERVGEISVQHVLRAQRAERRGFGDMDRGRARRRVARARARRRASAEDFAEVLDEVDETDRSFDRSL